MIKRNIFILVTGVLALMTSGCVERIIKVTTEPPGALLWLNDEEVGATPVTVPFTWYGKYDVLIRKEGYETIHIPRETPVPWFQWPALDFVCEILMPLTFKDHHDWHYQLEEQTSPDTSELIQRAQSLRNQAQ
ncbi:MAG: PEGA domain-containing protein [Sedimentisphaerales bacterium]|nr:PEGA domain-containing protein [Sedimentisphaerales bacterium]